MVKPHAKAWGINEEIASNVNRFLAPRLTAGAC